MIYALIHARIYDYRLFIDNGYIIFDDHIVDVGMMSDYIKPKECKEIDCHQQIILPGIVSGHTHLYSTFARGMNVPFNPDNFLDILHQLWWKMDHFLDKDMIYYSALMGGIDQLKNGTTTLIDHHASQFIKGSLSTIHKALVEDLNLRCILAFETSDRFSIEEAIEENLDFINGKYKDSAGLFGLHASISLSDDSLMRIKQKLNGQGIHIHVAESIMDEEQCMARYGMRVVQRLEHFGLINDQSLLVHCTHINEEEMDIIKKYGATIAINPTSNLNNAVGISKVKQFLNKGIPVIVGNDGLIQSQPIEYLNTYYLSHLDNHSPVGFSLEDVKQLIINTYDYANKQLKTRLGVFEKGAEADLLICPYQPFTPMTKDNVFGHIFFGLFPQFHPKRIFVKGQLVIEDYEFSCKDKEMVQKAINEAKKLWNLIEKEGENLEFKNRI
jgi:putative selenium metabolism protein SsnA